MNIKAHVIIIIIILLFFLFGLSSGILISRQIYLKQDNNYIDNKFVDGK